MLGTGTVGVGIADRVNIVRRGMCGWCDDDDDDEAVRFHNFICGVDQRDVDVSVCRMGGGGVGTKRTRACVFVSRYRSSWYGIAVHSSSHPFLQIRLWLVSVTGPKDRHQHHYYGVRRGTYGQSTQKLRLND